MVICKWWTGCRVTLAFRKRLHCKRQILLDNHIYSIFSILPDSSFRIPHIRKVEVMLIDHSQSHNLLSRDGDSTAPVVMLR